MLYKIATHRHRIYGRLSLYPALFRDLIWLMRGIMKADHKFYKEHKQYDFPQQRRGTMIAMVLLGTLMSSDKVKEKAGNMMNEGMLMPYKKILEKEKNNENN